MWFVFALATTFLWGLAELFYKKGAVGREKYSHLKICVMVGLVMGIHAVFTLLTEDFTYSLNYLITYLPVSACYILSMAFSFFGMRFIEESISDPIENTSGAIYRGGGLFALKNEDERKNQAAVIFAKWLTEKEHNLEFYKKCGFEIVKEIYV